jgi:hypothetical protein
MMGSKVFLLEESDVVRRWMKTFAAALVGCALWMGSAEAQTYKKPEETATGPRKPVGEYIVVVLLLALPMWLICRSSRR